MREPSPHWKAYNMMLGLLPLRDALPQRSRVCCGNPKPQVMFDKATSERVRRCMGCGCLIR